MQTMVLLLFVAVSTALYSAQVLKAPGYIKFVPELFTLFFAVYVLFAGTRTRFQLVPVRYWLAFGIIALVIICGAVSNDVGTGPLLGGMRYYVRAIPLFFLPLVFHFTDAQIVRQLQLILMIALVQVPMSMFQRYTVWSQNRFTGDPVFGTLVHSGILSIFLISVVLMLTALFLRKRIGRIGFIVLFFVLLFPTTINETKVTVFLLPIGLLTVMVMGAPKGRRVRIIATAFALLLAFGAVFVPVYDMMQAGHLYRKDLITFFTDEKQIGGYLEARHAGVGSTEQVGRGDAIKIPIQYLARDPLHMVFGLGIGNASHSELGEQFTGNYYGIFKSFLITSFTTFVLEIGLLATGLLFWIYWLLFRDTVALARMDDGLAGALAIGWTGVVVAMAISTFYAPIHLFDSLSYMYWYFSGLIVSRLSYLRLRHGAAGLGSGVKPADTE